MKTSPEYHGLLDFLLEGVQIIDFEWRYVYLNHTMAVHSKVPREELLGHTMMEKYPGIENTPLFKVLAQSMADRQSRRIENEFIFPDQSIRWFDLSIQAADEGLYILSLDITEQKLAEEKLHKSNNLYAFLSQVNQNIAHVTDTDTLFLNSCNIACEFGKFKMAWIGLFADNNTTINLVHEHGLPPETLPLFKAPIKHNGPQEYVLNSGEYYICNDIANNFSLEEWRPLAIRYGINSCILLPITSSGKVIGTFNLYSEKLDFSDVDEIALLVEVTKDISFALDTYETARKHKAVEALVLKSEKLFRHTLDNMLEGAQIHDFNWKYTYVNDALVKYSTYTRAELIGHTVMEKYPGVEQTEVFQAMERCMVSRLGEQLETEFVFPNGSKAYFELNIQPIPEGIFILSVDRTEQQKAKEKVLKVNRLYAFISAINQSIVHYTDENELLHHSCQVATEIGKFKMAWIGQFDHESNTVRLIAQSGVPESEYGRFKNAQYPSNGPQNHVLRTGSHYHCDDIFNDPQLESWRPFAEKYGIVSGIVLPIRKNGIVIGTLNLYSAKRNFADAEEIALLQEITGDISFALDNFEKAKKHKETEAQLVANEQRFRALTEKSSDMKTLTTVEGKIIYGSPAIGKTLGYLPETFIGTSIADYIKPQYHQEFATKKAFIMDKPGESFHFQWPLLHQHGNWVWCRGTVTNMLNVPGVNAFVANFIDVSEKKVLELQRVFDQTNLDALINNTNDLMWSVDTNMNLITANARFDELVTAAHGQTIKKGENILAGSSVDQQVRFKKYYERAFLGQAFREIEHTLSPAEFYSEISFSPIRSGKDVIGTACHSRDITGMKKMEAQLQDTITEISDYKYALNESSIVAITNQKGVITYVNDNFCKISKYSREELIGQDHRIVNSHFHPKAFIKDLWVTIANGDIWRGEMKNKAKDGSVYWVDTTIVPFLDDKGKPYQYTAIRADITQRKIVEEQLLKSERFNREVLDSLSAHIAVIDTLGEIVEVNEAWKRFGRENGGHAYLQPQINENYFTVCEQSFASGCETASVVMHGLKDVMTKKIPDFYLEYPCHSLEKDRWFALFAKQFEGDEELVVVAHQDISQRKFAEENLIRNNNELQKANFELDRFVYSVSHDLRAPLTSVLGLADFIEEETKEPETREHIQMIRSRINRLDGFIKNILSYSRNNRISREVEKISLKEVISGVVEALCCIKDATNIKFVIEINEDIPFYSDKQSLITIMENLVSNAIKFQNGQQPDRYIKITGNSDRDYFYLCIEDNGIGIPEKHQSQIFDMFFRLSGKIDGSGIGLYIAKEIVDKLEGSIRVVSEEGQGTAFHIQLKNLHHDE